jgi:hypothetical protein
MTVAVAFLVGAGDIAIRLSDRSDNRADELTTLRDSSKL